MAKRGEASNKRHDLAVLRAFVADGTHMDAIVDVTGWTPAKVQRLHAELYANEEQSRVGRRSEDVFVEYALQTEDNIAALDDVIERFRVSNQGSALVGAIKAKQDLRDRVIKLGQELGFVRREPQRSVHILANMSDPELQKHLQERLNELHRLAGRSGDTHMLDVPVPESKGEVIQIPVAPDKPKEKPIKRTPQRELRQPPVSTPGKAAGTLARIRHRLSRKAK